MNKPHQASIATSLKLLRIEMVLTSVVFAMPIMNVFFADEIGMSLAEVGLSQAAFTIALLLLNIPTGWLADRFSRKACNVVGDLVAALGFAMYAFATSFSDVIAAEIIIGIGLAFSGGADIGLLRAYCQELKVKYELVSARVAKQRPIAEMIAVSFGGLLGAVHPRLTIALSGVTYLTGAILSLFMVEAGMRRRTKTHPLRDMARITKYAMHGNKQLRWSILTFAFSRESTHPLIWILTPLLVLAGVPASILGIAWALNLAAVWLGARLAESLVTRYRDWQLVAMGASVYALSAVVLSGNVSLMTIAFYAGFGFTRGWFSAIMPPIIQKHTPDDMQSTVTSVAGSVAQVLYIPAIWGIAALGDLDARVSVIGSLVLFVPALVLCVYKLKTFEPT